MKSNTALRISSQIFSMVMDPCKVRSFVPHQPSLVELKDVLSSGLKQYFGEVEVSIVDCPDFTQHPYKLAVSGLHGKPAISDVGGVHNLIPHVNLKSCYSLKTVVETIYKSKEDYPISLFGPGGGAYDKTGFCCEFMGSASYSKQDDNAPKLVGCSCRYAYVDEDGKGRWLDQIDSDAFGLMGNFYSCQNIQGRVLKIHTKKRISKENFTEAIRAALLTRFGQNKPVSMGGVFLIKEGVAKLHIMPKYWPEEPATDESVNNRWLKYYHITKHPLVCLSVFHTYDPGYNLRMEHTHCFNLETYDEAGHYHYDVTPETVEYEGYFNIAEQVFRLDGPAYKK